MWSSQCVFVHCSAVLSKKTFILWTLKFESILIRNCKIQKFWEFLVLLLQGISTAVTERIISKEYIVFIFQVFTVDVVHMSIVQVLTQCRNMSLFRCFRELLHQSSRWPYLFQMDAKWLGEGNVLVIQGFPWGSCHNLGEHCLG